MLVESCLGNGGGASDGGPNSDIIFNDTDDEDVWDVCEIGDAKSCVGKEVSALWSGEFPFCAGITRDIFDEKNCETSLTFSFVYH